MSIPTKNGDVIEAYAVMFLGQIPCITDSRLYEDPGLKMTIDRGLINHVRQII